MIEDHSPTEAGFCSLLVNSDTVRECNITCRKLFVHHMFVYRLISLVKFSSQALFVNVKSLLLRIVITKPAVRTV